MNEYEALSELPYDPKHEPMLEAVFLRYQQNSDEWKRLAGALKNPGSKSELQLLTEPFKTLGRKIFRFSQSVPGLQNEAEQWVSRLDGSKKVAVSSVTQFTTIEENEAKELVKQSVDYLRHEIRQALGYGTGIND